MHTTTSYLANAVMTPYEAQSRTRHNVGGSFNRLGPPRTSILTLYLKRICAVSLFCDCPLPDIRQGCAGGRFYLTVVI